MEKIRIEDKQFKSERRELRERQENGDKTKDSWEKDKFMNGYELKTDKVIRVYNVLTSHGFSFISILINELNLLKIIGYTLVEFVGILHQRLQN